MRVGPHLLTFESKTEADDNFGQTVETWATAFQVRGSFQWLDSSEVQGVNKRNAEATVKFLIWYRAELDTVTASDRYRIAFNGRTWNIYPPIPLDSQPSKKFGGISGGFMYLEIEGREIH